MRSMEMWDSARKMTNDQTMWCYHLPLGLVGDLSTVPSRDIIESDLLFEKGIWTALGIMGSGRHVLLERESDSLEMVVEIMKKVNKLKRYFAGEVERLGNCLASSGGEG